MPAPPRCSAQVQLNPNLNFYHIPVIDVYPCYAKHLFLLQTQLRLSRFQDALRFHHRSHSAHRDGAVAGYNTFVWRELLHYERHCIGYGMY